VVATGKLGKPKINKQNIFKPLMHELKAPSVHGTKVVRLESAQLLLVDTESQSILLGTHTEKGFFPGRMTGLCAEMLTVLNQPIKGIHLKTMKRGRDPVNSDTPESVLFDEAVRHGINLTAASGLERRANLEFVEREQGAPPASKANPVTRVGEDWVLYAEVHGKPDVQASAWWEPEWVPIDAIPYHKMPVDDAVWYPPFLEGKKLCGRFVFEGRMLVGSAMAVLEEETVARGRILYPDWFALPSDCSPPRRHHMQANDSWLLASGTPLKRADTMPHERKGHASWREYSMRWREWRIREGLIGTLEGVPQTLAEHQLHAQRKGIPEEREAEGS